MHTCNKGGETKPLRLVKWRRSVQCYVGLRQIMFTYLDLSMAHKSITVHIHDYLLSATN